MKMVKFISVGVGLGMVAMTGFAQQPMSFFITSEGPGDGGNLGGLAGADAHCQQLAAAAGQGVFANTTSSALTVTLPAGSLGDEVTIVDYAGTFDSNALTVAANGSEKIFASTDDLTVSTERAAFTLVYTDSTQGWLFKND